MSWPVRITLSLLLYSVSLAQDGPAVYDFCAAHRDINQSSFTQCGSCVGRCNAVSSTDVYCSCDANCMVYKDCCWDFSVICPDSYQSGLNLSERMASSSSVCTRLYSADAAGEVSPWDIRLIKRCAGTGDACPNLNVDPYYNYTRAVPVIDKETGLYYINAECAYCNGVAELEAIDLVYGCVSKQAIDRGARGIYDDVTVLLAAMDEMEGTPRWQALYDHAECYDLYQASLTAYPPRRCVHGVVESCPSQCENQQLRDLCENRVQSYTKSYASTTYKNVFCAICHLYEIPTTSERYTECNYHSFNNGWSPVSMVVTLRVHEVIDNWFDVHYADIACIGEQVILPSGVKCDNILCPGDFAISSGICIALHTTVHTEFTVLTNDQQCLDVDDGTNQQLLQGFKTNISQWLRDEYTLHVIALDVNLFVSCAASQTTHFHLNSTLLSDVNETANQDMTNLIQNHAELAMVQMLTRTFIVNGSQPVFSLLQPTVPPCRVVDDACIALHTSVHTEFIVQVNNHQCINVDVETNQHLLHSYRTNISQWLRDKYRLDVISLDVNLSVSCPSSQTTYFYLNSTLYADINETANQNMADLIQRHAEMTMIDMLTRMYNNSGSQPSFSVPQPIVPPCRGSVLSKGQYDLINGTLYVTDSSEIYYPDEYFLNEVNDSVCVIRGIAMDADAENNVPLIVGLSLLAVIVVIGIAIFFCFTKTRIRTYLGDSINMGSKLEITRTEANSQDQPEPREDIAEA